jgi:very-short-patch-repair endonuclease
MKIVESLLNRSEEVVFRELQSICADNNLKVFSKPRLSDVISKGADFLTKTEFDYYTRSHCDFVVTDPAYRPLMVIEYDGPSHIRESQQERDKIKDDLCSRAGLGMLRIHDKHVTQYRGMSVLRWIVEVTELQKAFYEAQEKGQVPYDEPFDPAMFDSIGGGHRFPYWLSAPATQSFDAYFKTLDPAMPKGWDSVLGHDNEGTGYRLSCLYFGEHVLWAKTAVRKQILDFPHYDLLNELDACELGIRLKQFRNSEIGSIGNEEFGQIFVKFCERYNAHPSHSMGSFPFNVSFNFKSGWSGEVFGGLGTHGGT